MNEGPCSNEGRELGARTQERSTAKHTCRTSGSVLHGEIPRGSAVETGAKVGTMVESHLTLRAGRPVASACGRFSRGIDAADERGVFVVAEGGDRACLERSPWRMAGVGRMKERNG